MKHVYCVLAKMDSVDSELIGIYKIKKLALNRAQEFASNRKMLLNRQSGCWGNKDGILVVEKFIVIDEAK